MKILLVNDFAGDGIGGTEAVVKMMYDKLSEKHDVRVFYAGGLGWDVKSEKAKTYPEPEPKILSRVWNVYAKHRLQTLVDDWNPSVIHYHNVYSRLSPSVFTVETKARKVLTLHDYRFNCPNAQCKKQVSIDGSIFHVPCDISFTPTICAWLPPNNLGGGCCSVPKAYYQWIKNKMFLRVISNLDVVVAPSEYMRDYFKKTTGYNAIWIPNAIDAKNFTDYSSRPVKHILLIGRMAKEKGFEGALEYIQRNYPTRLVVVVGDGPLYNELSRKFRKPNVIFTGRLTSKKDIEEFYKDALVWVPSIWQENASMVLLESMAYGRPSIATNVGGNRQYASMTYPQLTGPTLEFDKSKDEYMVIGRAARKKAVEEYSVEGYIEWMEELYNG